MFFNQFGEKVFPLIPNTLGSEFLHVLFGLCPETKAKILITHELSQCFGQTFRSWIAQQAVLAVFDERIDARAILATNGRQAKRHGLGERQRKAFEFGREGENGSIKELLFDVISNSAKRNSIV